MGISSLPITQNLVRHRLMKSYFILHHTFQHCLDTFTLNKCAKCLNLAIHNQPMQKESNSSLLTCAKVYKLTALLLAVSTISSFPQILKHEADMVVFYHLAPYLQHRYSWVFTGSAVPYYWKCYINIVTQTYSGFY